MKRMKMLVLAFLAAGMCVSPAKTYDPINPITWSNGVELLLFGTGDLAATKGLLAPHGLEPVVVNGGPFIALVQGEFRGSNYGEFADFFIAVMAKKPGDTSQPGESWYFFGHCSQGDQYRNALKHVWGSNPAHCQTRIEVSNWETGPNGARAHTGEWVNKMDFYMADKPLKKKKDTYKFEIHTPEGKTFRHEASGTTYERPYDSKTDYWIVDGGLEHNRQLKDMKFTPLVWNLYYSDKGIYYPPHSGAGSSAKRGAFEQTLMFGPGGHCPNCGRCGGSFSCSTDKDCPGKSVCGPNYCCVHKRQ